MRKIYKYKLEATDIQTIKVPKLIGSINFKEQFLSIKVQNKIPYIWCLVDEEEETQDIAIRIVGTGNPISLLSKEDYMGSYVLFDEGLVFHVFLEKYQKTKEQLERESKDRYWDDYASDDGYY